MKILIIDNTHPILIENLIKNGFEITHKDDLQREDLLEIIPDYEALVVRSKVEIDKEIIDRAVKLKCIARVGAGLDAIDLDYAKEKNIKVLNSPEGNRDAVAEHALGMLLALFNKLIIADSQVRNSLWLREENRGLEIKGKTIGIIGYGNMGQAFAKRLQGFDARVIAYDKYKKDYGNEYAKQVELEDIFKEADILSLHIPLTQETNYMVEDTFLSKFSKPIYIINTARGKVVKTKDLLLALREKRVLGACLDVLEFEAFSSELSQGDKTPEELKELFSLQNVVLSPHVAGWSVESHYKLAYFLSEKIITTLKYS